MFDIATYFHYASNIVITKQVNNHSHLSMVAGGGFSVVSWWVNGGFLTNNSTYNVKNIYIHKIGFVFNINQFQG